MDVILEVNRNHGRSLRSIDPEEVKFFANIGLKFIIRIDIDASIIRFMEVFF